MAGWAALGWGIKALVLGGGAVAVAGVASLVLQGRPEPAPSAVLAPAAEPPAAAPVAVAPVTAPVDPAEPEIVPPSFDVVRVEPDGSALVAGRAMAGLDVAVLVDGAEVSLARADPQGRFVVFLTLPASASARIMTLELRPPGGAPVPSVDQVLLAPTQAMPETAQVEEQLSAAPAPEPEPTAPATDVAAAPEPDPAPAETAAVPDPASPAAPKLPVAPKPEAAPAAAPQAALLLSGDTVKVLQSAPDAPEAPTGAVSIDAITYSAAGAVTLSGRGAALEFVRLYLDNKAMLETAIAADGTWGGVLPAVPPGVYTLRADQISAAGSVTSRTETPFLREDPTAFAAPEPAIDATTAPARVSVTVQPGFTLWQIARENYGDGALYVRVYDANKTLIRDPDLIYPGQVLSVPRPD